MSVETTNATTSRIAVVQRAPALLDREGSLEIAVAAVAEAATAGARLVVFSETFLPGYPAWIWRLRPGGDGALSGELYQRLWESAVDLETDGLRPLQEAARAAQVTVVCGINEREGSFSRSTLYNTVVVIGADGRLQNRHRKLIPTNPERMVWGRGDGSGLQVVATPVGRIGTLICWENYMPLARQALYAQGVEIYIAPTYDSGEGWIGSLQHIAREGRCWVIGCGNLLRGSDIPADQPGKEQLYPDPGEWINGGDSIIIAPGGEVLAGPLHREAGILYAEVDRARVAAARRLLDLAGHYGRPDIFGLQVNRRPQPPVDFEE